MNKAAFSYLSITALVLLLVSCTNVQTGSINLALSDQTSQTSAPAKWVTTSETDKQIANDWSEIIADPVMLSLITEALQNSPSLASSAERVARSQAILRQSRSSLLPRLDLAATANSSTFLQNSAFSERYSAGLASSWELDLWGRIRAGVSASEFDLAAAKAFYRNAREALIAQTARSYIAAIEAQKQLDLNDETLTALKDTLRIVKIRHDLGSASRREVVLAQSDVANSHDRLEAAAANVRSSLRSLEVLLGRYPDATLELPANFPNILPAMAVGQPADILRRRPDVLAAHNNLASAFSALKIESSNRWPRLTLSSDLSSAATDPGNLFDPATIAFSLGLRLADNLFDGGLTKGRIEAAQSGSRQAIADYGQTVLDAFLEVENLLDQQSVLNRRYGFTQTASAAARETLRLAEISYKEGAVDLLDVLTFRQRSFQADRNLLVIERLRFDAKINLYLALGGTGLDAPGN